MTTKTELGLKTSHTSAGTKGACSCWGLHKTNISDWKHRNLFSPYFNFWSVLHSQYLPLANLKADFICMVPWPISVKIMWRLLMAFSNEKIMVKKPKKMMTFWILSDPSSSCYPFCWEMITSVLCAPSTYDKCEEHNYLIPLYIQYLSAYYCVYCS